MRSLPLAAAVVCLLGLAAGTAAAAPTLPVVYDFPVALAAGVAMPTSSPPGANVPCALTAAHPRPVVLVHGTVEDMRDNFGAISPLLADAGYCVYSFNYGGIPGQPLQATGDIPTSAGELATFVDGVLASTKAKQVDIVGHSQGGMMPRWYLKFDGGAAKVHALVALTPSNHGTTASGLLTLASAIPGGSAALGVACTACNQQQVGSAFLQKLNAGGDTVRGVSYTVITTRYDEVVTPYTSAFLTGPKVTNIVVQDGCALDGAEHLAISYDERALAYVRNALDPAHPVAVPCVPVLPLVGG